MGRGRSWRASTSEPGPGPARPGPRVPRSSRGVLRTLVCPRARRAGRGPPAARRRALTGTAGHRVRLGRGPARRRVLPGRAGGGRGGRRIDPRGHVTGHRQSRDWSRDSRALTSPPQAAAPADCAGGCPPPTAPGPARPAAARRDQPVRPGATQRGHRGARLARPFHLQVQVFIQRAGGRERPLPGPAAHRPAAPMPRVVPGPRRAAGRKSPPGRSTPPPGAHLPSRAFFSAAACRRRLQA